MPSSQKPVPSSESFLAGAPDQNKLMNLRHIFCLLGKKDIVQQAREAVRDLLKAAGLKPPQMEEPVATFGHAFYDLKKRIQGLRQDADTLALISAHYAQVLGQEDKHQNPGDFAQAVADAFKDAEHARAMASYCGYGGHVASMRVGIAGIKYMVHDDKADPEAKFPEGQNLGHAVKNRLNEAREEGANEARLEGRRYEVARLQVITTTWHLAGETPPKEHVLTAKRESYALLVAGSLRLQPEYERQWTLGWSITCEDGAVIIYATRTAMAPDKQAAQGLLMDAARQVWDDLKPQLLNYTVG